TSMGLVATGSHAFKVGDLHVPATRCFEIDAAKARIPLPVYQYPFLQLAETTLAVNYAGLAHRFIGLCDEIFEARLQAGKNIPRNLHADAARTLFDARTDFYDAVDISWSLCSQM